MAASCVGRVSTLTAAVLLLVASCKSIPWVDELHRQVRAATFAGSLRLCSADPQQNDGDQLTLRALDSFFLPAPLDSRIIRVRSSSSTNMVSCESSVPTSVAYAYVLSSFESSLNWTSVCRDTLNLTLRVERVAGSVSFQLRPCNYAAVHANVSQLSLQQWILLTYTTSWQPQWLTRSSTVRVDGTASVVLRSISDTRFSTTWSSVRLSQRLPSALTPATQVAASLTTVASGRWYVTCISMNCSTQLQLEVTDAFSSSTAGLPPLRIDCSNSSSYQLLVGEAAVANPSTPTPKLQVGGSGLWGAALLRAVAVADVAGFRLCRAASGLLIVASDLIVVSKSLSVGTTLSVTFAACDAVVNETVAAATAKILLLRSVDWTNVCSNSSAFSLRLRIADTTAALLRPCPSPTLAATAWSLLTSSLPARYNIRRLKESVNTTTLEIGEWRLPAAIRWQRLRVDSGVGDQVQRLAAAFAEVDSRLWPAFCHVAGVTDAWLSVRIASSDLANRTAELFLNCTNPTALLSTPPPTTTTTTTTTTAAETTTRTRTNYVEVQEQQEVALQTVVVVLVLVLLGLIASFGICRLVLPGSLL